MDKISDHKPQISNSKWLIIFIGLCSLVIARWSLVIATAQSSPQIVINELQYHPLSDDHGEEYIELYNTGAITVDLSGWQFSDGIHYTFPAGASIPPDGYVVVGHDPATVEAVYGVSGVLGPFESGRLDNGGERVAIEDAGGVLVDEVAYDDHHPWPELPDGKGPSLELISPAFDNNCPCSWGASAERGTPGVQNSVYSLDNIPPCITGVAHTPVFPTSSQPVTVTALINDNSTVTTATLHCRPEGAPGYTSLAMADSGGSLYTGVIPPQANGLYVEFYVTAVDDEGAERLVPDGAPGGVSAETGRFVTVSYIYQVEDTPPTGALPIYRLITTAANWTELTTRDLFSNVLLDATFVHEREVFYNVGIRYRGESTRDVWPRPYRIKFRDEHEFEDRERINLVSDELGREALAHDLFQRAGMPAPNTHFVTLYINESEQGDYLDIEQVDNDFLETHFPDNDTGNLYRGFDGADLKYRGPDPDSYRASYLKENNEDAADPVGDYSDVIALTDALTNSPHETFRAETEAVADMRQWLRWFAIQAVLDNHEGALWLGSGDDYFLYHRPSDGRFLLVSWDHDCLFLFPDHSIWEPDWLGPEIVRRILHYPDFTRWYYQDIASIAANEFSVAEMYPRIDALPDVVSGEKRNELKQYVAARIPALMGQIPGATLSINTNGGQDWVTTDEAVTLEGNCSPLRGVTVNGSTEGVQYPAATDWRYTSALPTRDNVFVVSDGLDSRTITVYRDIFHGGALAENTTLPTSIYPYDIANDIIVPAGVTLTIEPGSMLQFRADRYLRVNEGGRLLAEGTVTQPITFTVQGGSYWGGILFDRTQEDNRIRHAVVEYTREVIANPRSHGVSAYGARVTIADSVIRYTDDSVAVKTYPWFDRDPTIYLLHNEIYGVESDGVHVTGGYAFIQGNHIHDVRRGDYPLEGIEVSHMTTPARLFDNHIHDVSDDCMDLNHSSAIIERNELYHCGDKGISIGHPSSTTLVNNLIYACLGNDADPYSGTGIAVKDGAISRIVNNTVVGNRRGIYLYEGHVGEGGGHGTVVNSIVWGNGAALKLDALSTVVVTYSDIEGGWSGEGHSPVEATVSCGGLGHHTDAPAGNIDADPRFHEPQSGDYRLMTDSLCMDAGTSEGAPGEDLRTVPRPQGPGYDMGAHEAVRLSINTNGGADFTTLEPEVTLEGTGSPLREGYVNGNAAQCLTTSVTATWRYTSALWTWANTFVVTDGLDALTVTIYLDRFRGGALTESTTLTTSAVPYFITDDITVPVGITLTIQPGVTLQLWPGRSLIVYGRLAAEGTPSQPIRFTRAPPSVPPNGGEEEGGWGAILFDSSEADNRIAYATVEHAGTHSIIADHSRLRVEQSTIRYLDGTGILVTAGDVVVRGNHVYSARLGIALSGAAATVERNELHHCTDRGIAIAYTSSVTLVNNLVYTCMEGIAILDNSSARIVNNTVADNQIGIKVQSGDLVTMVNSIAWSNGTALTVSAGSAISVAYSNVEGGWPGEENVDANPLFRAPQRHSYRLLEDSPCVDTGTPVGAPEEDIRGIYRPHGEGYDRGAHEFFEYFSCYLPLVLRSH